MHTRCILYLGVGRDVQQTYHILCGCLVLAGATEDGSLPSSPECQLLSQGIIDMYCASEWGGLSAKTIEWLAKCSTLDVSSRSQRRPGGGIDVDFANAWMHIMGFEAVIMSVHRKLKGWSNTAKRCDASRGDTEWSACSCVS